MAILQQWPSEPSGVSHWYDRKWCSDRFPSRAHPRYWRWMESQGLAGSQSVSQRERKREQWEYWEEEQATRSARAEIEWGEWLWMRGCISAAPLCQALHLKWNIMVSKSDRVHSGTGFKVPLLLLGPYLAVGWQLLCNTTCTVWTSPGTPCTPTDLPTMTP